MSTLRAPALVVAISYVWEEHQLLRFASTSVRPQKKWGGHPKNQIPNQKNASHFEDIFFFLVGGVTRVILVEVKSKQEARCAFYK